MAATASATSTAPPQGALWGTRARDWAEHELQQRALYEHTLRSLGIGRSAIVLDVGCGSGVFCRLAADAGAHVTGLDAAASLVEIAKERVPEGEFRVGDLQFLPFDDDSFDVVLSIFAIIFTSDPPRAAAELLRVLAPGGRALLTTWVPEGGIHTAFGAIGRAMGALAPEPPPPPFGWGEPDRVRGLFEPHGATVTFDERAATFTVPSAEEFLAEAEQHHPMAIAARGALGAAGRYDAVRAEAKAALEAHSESPDELVLTSRYLLVTVRP